MQYRQNILDIIEKKLLKMKELGEKAKGGKLSAEELAAINKNINRLAEQVNALDEESRKIELNKEVE